MRFTAGAYGVIFDKVGADARGVSLGAGVKHAHRLRPVGRVLFCHRRDCDFWNLPGGGVESGEAPWQAVVREVREEVGLEVEVVRLAGLYAGPR